ncbi:MAG: hypothetical protein GY801_19255 [bacterium]|nr:hypothetical protein [bacterium]
MAQTLTLEDIRQKLKVVKPKTAGKNAPDTKACSGTRITALEGGLSLNRPDGGTIFYADISLLLPFHLDIDPDTWYIELFVYGQEAPFRLSQKAINYRQFLPDISQRSKDNFFSFFLFLIDRADSVYVDENTLEFLKNKKLASYPDFRIFENYTQQLWQQVLNWMKFRCDSCAEVYWVDEAKVSPEGAKTKCVKCRHIITVKRREKPQPLHTASNKPKIVSCPHCRYENQEGAQFCVMCQEVLVDFKARAKAKTQEPAAVPKTKEKPSAAAEPAEKFQGDNIPESALKLSPAAESPESADLDLPLQARGKFSSKLSLGEIDTSLQSDINSVEKPFGWYGKFAGVMQVLGFIFMTGGLLIGLYIYFAFEGPPPPDIITPNERFNYSIIAVVSGIIASLISLVVGNIISLNLQIERNTKLTALLLQRLISRSE